jgi:hypothetical protein
MKYTLASLALAATASAATIRRDTCSFTLTASGGQSGTVGQLDDGQNRVGPNLPVPTGQYSINNGQITDSKGSGCILTPPTAQFQCDQGATPTGGFSIGSNGQVEYNGSQTFYACPASDTEYNIYTQPVTGQTKCVEIELTASDCYTQSSSAAQQSTSSQKPATSQRAPQTSSQELPASVVTVTETASSQCPTAKDVTVTATVTQQETPREITVTTTVTQQAPKQTTAQQSQPAQQPTSAQKSQPTQQSTSPFQPQGTQCPANLNGAYQYPHLIVPVSSSSPDKAYGTSYNGEITSDTSSIFNFDIPTSYTGTCSLLFLFPEQAQLETSSYTFNGSGEINFKQLSTVATQSTTYSSIGSTETDFGVKTVTPGSSTVIASFTCPAGQAVSYELSSVGGTSLTYFQDYNPSPIGLYVVSC